MTRPKILAVDDTPANLIALRRVLGKVDVELIEASSGNAALAATLEHEFALILLDVQMPEMDGFEVAQLLSGEERTRMTPIIFVTAAADDLNRLMGYGSGAVDYIAKPINEVILKSKVRVFLELYRARRALEDEVKRREAAETAARHQATHDPLTGLPNRLLFMDRLNGGIERARRLNSEFSLLYVDIDGFKPVNDRHGHPAGDALLQAIAQRLRAGIRATDTVARLGGDEFAVLLETPADAAEAQRRADDLIRALRVPFDLAVGSGVITGVQIGASIGIALYRTHGATVEALVHKADEAMYAAKRGGKNRAVLAG